MTTQTIGFIILRHVSEPSHNRLWKKCYENVRQFYPENKIVIIDDNSNYELMEDESYLYNTNVIQSEYIGRGVLLPYYYFSKYKWFDVGVIIHDSVFINRFFDFSTDTCKFFWEIGGHGDDLIEVENKILSSYKDLNLLVFHRCHERWTGCFGAISTINYDFLSRLNDKFPLSKLIDFITDRTERMAFERIFGCLVRYLLHSENHPINNIFIDCHNYYSSRKIKLGTFSYDEYMKGIDKYKKFPIVKLFARR